MSEQNAVPHIQKESRNNLSFVHGRIVISAETKTFSGGTAYIFLEDISLADAPSRIAAETKISNIKHQSDDSGKTTGIPFRIDFSDEAYNPKNYCSLRVWIDVNRDGEQSVNDLYSDRIYPVLTRGTSNFAEILLHPQD
ncbi:MAG: hypothetical protein LH472_05900 [Pyrinomonadaceae bacterium]|nr:hypothetical protein [Pyrinomonadaceae bacterium]